MPHTKQLTQSLKRKDTPIVIKRDYSNEEPYCFYCEGGFVATHKHYCQVWDHLNNNEEDQRVENLVWAHWICNEQKKDNIEWQIRASEKLKENIKWAESEFMRECEGDKKIYTDEEELTDAEVGRVIDRITKTYLNEHLKGPNAKDYLLRSDTRSCITYLVKQDVNGRGSPQAVDRAIDTYCCTIADYVSKKEDGKRIIRLRKKEEMYFEGK